MTTAPESAAIDGAEDAPQETGDPPPNPGLTLMMHEQDKVILRVPGIQRPIVVTLVAQERNRVRVGFNADPCITIDREEIDARKHGREPPRSWRDRLAAQRANELVEEYERRPPREPHWNNYQPSVAAPRVVPVRYKRRRAGANGDPDGNL